MTVKKTFGRIFGLLVILFSMWFCGFSLSVLLKRGSQAFVILGQMVPPDISYLSKVLSPLAATVQMSVAGSLIGAMLALPAGVAACPSITGHSAAAVVVRMVVSVIRAVPVLVIALVTSFMLGTGTTAGIAAIACFTFGIMARMTWEKLEQIDLTAFESLCAMGNGRVAAFRHAVWPQMCPVFLADALYALEMNIRHAAILGYVGAGGVGLLLNEKIAWRDYAKAGMILTMLLVIVVVIEQVGEYLRSRMLLGIKTSDREKMFWTVAFVILILWSLTAVRWPMIPAKGMQILKGILAGLLHPDWTLIFNRTVNGVPWLLLETLCIAIAGTAIGAVLAVPAALVGSYTTFYRYPAFLVRFLMAAVRTMPSIIAGLIFIRVTGPGAFAGLMTMAFLSFGMCSKMFIHTLDGMDRELLAACRSMGLGWPAMMRHVVWPSCKRALHADVWYRLDVNLRDASVLGFVGAGGIGAPLIFAMNGYAWSMAGAYLLGLLVLVLAADGFSSKLSQKDGAE